MATAAIRILCIRRRSLLLVRDERGWTLPRTELANGETTEQAAARALASMFGVRARLVRRIATPHSIRGLMGDWLVVAETEVDVDTEIDASEAAFHELSPERPVGPLDMWLWGALAPIVATTAYQSAWIGAQVSAGAR